MSDLLYLLEHGSGKYQNKISDLISPLARIFGVNAHAYYRIDAQGFLTYLSNLPEIAEYYFANQLYVGNPFLKHPSLVQPGFVLAQVVNNPNFQDGQSFVEQKHQLNSHLLVFEKQGDVLHAHGFATTHQNVDLTQMYLNNLDRLKLFCRYFREETANIQRSVDDIQVDFGGLIGARFYENEPLDNEPFNKRADENFFSWMNKAHGGLELVKPLSERELECLALLLEGHSSGAIGKQLAISARTVEHHIENIKNKLSCSTKGELFTFVSTLKACGGELSFLKFSWK